MVECVCLIALQSSTVTLSLPEPPLTHAANMMPLRTTVFVQFNTSVVDMWTHYGSWPYNRMVHSYRFLGRRPLLWRIMYELGRVPLFRT
jgi:hypothetical protein